MPATRYTRARLYIDWSRTGVYVEETDRLVSASGTWRRNNPEDSITSPRGIVSQATITLINHDGRFSTINEDGPLSTYIQSGGYYQAPMYLTVEDDLDEERIFTGVIKGPQEVGGNIENIGQITFDCRSREELLLQQKVSTDQTTVKSYHDDGRSEAGFILAWLVLAGIDPADFIHDPGNFVIPWAWLDNESPLEDIWQLAAAGGGAFYTDPEGKFIYETMSHWVGEVEDTSYYEAFTDNDYSRGSVKINDDELYQTVIVEVASRNVAGSAVVWDSPEQVSVPTGSTKVVTANLQQPLYQLDFIGYDPSSAGGLDMTANITGSTAAYAQRIEVTFINTATTHAAQIRNFKIYGKALNGGPVTEIKRTSTNAFWENRSGRTRTVSSPYIQSQTQGTALADFLLQRHELPRVFYSLSDCKGKTSRRLGQRIVIQAGRLTSTDRPALITSIAWRWSATGGFVQNLEAFDCFNLFPYALTNELDPGRAAWPQYLRLGTDLISDGSDPANDHRVFY